MLVTDLLSATAWSFSCAAECLAGGGSTALEVPSRDSDSRHQMAQTYRDYHFYMTRSTINCCPGLTLIALLHKGAVCIRESDVDSLTLTGQT